MRLSLDTVLLLCIVPLIFGLFEEEWREKRHSKQKYTTTTKAPGSEEYVEQSEEEVEKEEFTADDLVDKHRVGHVFQLEKITSVFTDKKSFLCSFVKPQLHTGTSVRDLSPEDIDIVAAMGDSLASGRGLWPPTDVEFRGAAFPIGGDANIDGLVTIPRMGTVENLPTHQFNVASKGATTKDLPKQAEDLVARLKSEVNNLVGSWVFITIAIGTEEICTSCTAPSSYDIRVALATLRKAVPRSLVVLLGPVHVSSTYKQNINLLRTRCKCLEALSKSSYRNLISSWANTYYDVQHAFDSLSNATFGVLAIPQLKIHSRDPSSLLIYQDKPLLNRKGHMYAAKWLWNRLMFGPAYNDSSATYSSDAYFCPAIGCPYFRTPQNFDHCSILTTDDWNALQSTTKRPRTTTPKSGRREMIRRNLVLVIAIVVGISLCLVCSFGTIFYIHGLRATKGRFEELAGV